jgi:hypothetical protein
VNKIVEREEEIDRNKIIRTHNVKQTPIPSVNQITNKKTFP